MPHHDCSIEKAKFPKCPCAKAYQGVGSRVIVTIMIQSIWINTKFGTPSDINIAGYILYSKSSRAKHIIKAPPFLMVNIP